MNAFGRPTRLLPVLALALGCGNPTIEERWEPAEEGARVSREIAQTLCGPLLERGQAALLVGGEGEGASPREPYDLCMRQQGWVLHSENARDVGDAMRAEVDEFLDREVAPRHSKRELASAFGAPVCYGAPPGTGLCGPLAEGEPDPEAETCVWEFAYHSRVARQRFTVVLTCLLPQNGGPRGEGSCQLDAR